MALRSVTLAPTYAASPYGRGVVDRATAPTPFGRWGTRARVEILGGTSAERRVVLLAPLWWRDPDGTIHTVPEGLVSDGATIPRAVWWLMGGRLNLDYLRAALVHDYACLVQPDGSSSADAAIRFYRGLRADGMGYHRARACYYGVRRLGPQWG